MTQAEKLEALIHKAVTDSWKMPSWILVEVKYSNWDFAADERVWPVIIFSHDFARALFGSEMVKHSEVDDDGNTWHFSTFAYQYYPMQAVISDNPIDYMYKAVFGEA